MLLLDLTLPTPAGNLALDEALLDLAESGERGETLRFWEPRDYFVVVGYSNRISSEVNVEFCKANRIPIFRRCTGGGTVLQGPGMLNYSLILKADVESPSATIHDANTFIMERNRRAIIEALHSRHPAPGDQVRIEGHTDLAINGKKFSGNAQRRRKNYLLFHGSFLVAADLPKIESALRMPSKQPDYRANRPHQDFLINLPLLATDLKDALRNAWKANQAASRIPESPIPGHLIGRYQSPAWNLKFP